jgi:hypothetical protein
MAVDLILSTDPFRRCSFLTTFGQMTRRGQGVCSGEVTLSNFALPGLIPKRYEAKKLAGLIGGLLSTNPSSPGKN